MIWLIYAYLLISLIIAGSAAMNAGWSTGLYAIATAFLSLIAGGGLKAGLLWGDWTQKIGGTAIAVVLIMLSQWLSGGFNVHVLGQPLTGSLWGWVGICVCFLFTNRRLAGMQSEPEALSSARATAVPPPTNDRSGRNEIATEHIDANTYFRRGEAYSEGDGVAPNAVEAATWWRKAAEQGHAAAQYSLGVSHLNGIGVQQDYVLAHMWLSLAEVTAPRPGDDRILFTPSSEELRDDLEARMTPAEIANAKRLIHEWRLRQRRKQE